MRLFKYLSSRYVDDLVRRGRLLFRNLTYFRLFEGSGRGDLYEGRHIDRPGHGVKLTNMTTGHTVEGDFAFVNSVDTESVYAFCLSTQLSQRLYAEFHADACVEITSSAQFIRDCRAAMRRDAALRGCRLTHGLVEYYAETEPVSRDVKDPMHLPLFKPRSFAYQAEYRLVLASVAGSELEQRIVLGSALGETERPVGESRSLWLKLRGIRQYMKVHRADDP